MPGLQHLFTEKAIKQQFSAYVKDDWGIGKEVVEATTDRGKTGSGAQKKILKVTKKAEKAAQYAEIEELSAKRAEEAKAEANAIVTMMAQVKLEAEGISLFQGGIAQLGDSDRGLDVFSRSCEVLSRLASPDLPSSSALTAAGADCILVLEMVAEYLRHEDVVDAFIDKYNVVDTATFHSTFTPSLALQAQTSPERPGGDPKKKRTSTSDLENLDLDDIKAHLKRNFARGVRNVLVSLKAKMDFIHKQAVEREPAKKTKAGAAAPPPPPPPLPAREEPDPSLAAKKEALIAAEERVKKLKEELIKEQMKVRKLQHELNPVEQQDEETRFIAVMARPRLGGAVSVWSTSDEPLSPLFEDIITTRLSPYSSLKSAMEDKNNTRYSP